MTRSTTEKLVQRGMIGLITVLIVTMLLRTSVTQFTDRWNLKYLDASIYDLERACEGFSSPGMYLPKKCTPEKYRLGPNSIYVHRYGLPPVPVGASGWVRVGDAAILIGHGETASLIYQSRPSVFGKGVRP